VHFITGLLPVSVSVYGIPDKFPNGNDGYLWTDARAAWSNSACLNPQNALGFPNDGPGTNTQGLTMYCAGGAGPCLEHNDQYRGLRYCYTRQPGGYGATIFSEPSPDYFQYIDLGARGLRLSAMGTGRSSIWCVHARGM
jgi:D-galacturonate reductase